MRVWSSHGDVGVILASDEYSEAVKRLFSFLRFADGWHFGSGAAPTALAIHHALAIMAEMRRLGANAVEVFPDPAGGVMVAGHGKDSCIEVLSGPEGECDFVKEDENEEDIWLEGLSFGEAVEMVRLHGWKGSSFDYYRPSTTVEKNVALIDWLFKTRPVAGFPSSIRNAQSAGTGYVTMSSGTIANRFLVTRQSFGDLARKSYLTARA